MGDWGLGNGDWAQSPIPNPHILIIYLIIYILFKNKIFKKFNYFLKDILKCRVLEWYFDYGKF